jgi:ABC-type dipeptide/oligopeptide/nickel transport system permease subunit
MTPLAKIAIFGHPHRLSTAILERFPSAHRPERQIERMIQKAVHESDPSCASTSREPGNTGVAQPSRRSPSSAAWQADGPIRTSPRPKAVAPFIAPYGEAQIVGDQYLPWSITDQIGRDMLARLIYGARNTIGIAVLATGLAFLLGGTLGLLATVLGGWTDQLLARMVDILMAITQLIFALVLLVIFESSLTNLILIVAVLDGTRVFRLTRAVAMNVAVQEFVEAARLQNERLSWIMGRSSRLSKGWKARHVIRSLVAFWIFFAIMVLQPYDVHKRSARLKSRMRRVLSR